MNYIPLYPGAVPGSEDRNYPEQAGMLPGTTRIGWVRNVTKPTLISYLPDAESATGMGMVVCPGGAFHGLAIDHEGHAVARWLQERGIAAFVLKYSLVHTPESQEEYDRQEMEMRALPFEENEKHIEEVTRVVRALALADGLQAVKMVRERSSEFGINPQQIGIMGFSAGGYVTAKVALNYDDSSRPDFAGVIYGALVKDIKVPPDAPPLFIALTNNDEIAVGPSLELYTAWRRSGHPVEIHIYAKGEHGFGMNKLGLPVDGWIERFGEWLQSI